MTALAASLVVHNAQQALIARVRAMAFDKQLAFMDDRARLKSALCTRRAGKTAAAALYLFVEALARANTTCLYLALTRESAKRLLWRWLKRVNTEAQLGLPSKAFNETSLSVTLPNGSVIYLLGADAKQEEKEKLLGQAYSLVIVDESASFRIDLRALVYKVLRPATADYAGTIALIGTPGDFMGPVDDPALFYAATTGKEPGWSPHAWSTFDNPHMIAAWTAELAEIERDRPRYKLTADYRCMYLGEWAIDHTRRVYKYTAENMIDAAPDDIAHTIIVLDLGWNDPTAFLVAGWCAHDPTLYFLRSFKAEGMLLSDVEKDLTALRERHPEAEVVVDGANKQAVEELSARMGIALTPTDKAGKADFIRMMNTDLAELKIRVIARDCRPLLDEWDALLWDERSRKPTERQDMRNDAADTGLYGWRFARNHIERPKVPVHYPTEEEKLAEWAAREGARLLDPDSDAD